MWDELGALAETEPERDLACENAGGPKLIGQ
jgi:hypothetical protein